MNKPNAFLRNYWNSDISSGIVFGFFIGFLSANSGDVDNKWNLIRAIFGALIGGGSYLLASVFSRRLAKKFRLTPSWIISVLGAIFFAFNLVIGTFVYNQYRLTFGSLSEHLSGQFLAYLTIILFLSTILFVSLFSLMFVVRVVVYLRDRSKLNLP